MSSKLRIFVAIDLSEVTRLSLAAIQQALARKGLDVKWTHPDQFHVTLKFLGEIDAPSADRAVAATAKAAAGAAPFTLTFQGIGAFPDWERPRVLWSGVAEGRDALIRLAHRVEEAMTQAGFDPWDRPFRPHLTLGRVREMEPGVDLGAPVRALADRVAGPDRIERVIVYRSLLRPQGPIYTEVASFPLGQPR